MRARFNAARVSALTRATRSAVGSDAPAAARFGGLARLGTAGQEAARGGVGHFGGAETHGTLAGFHSEMAFHGVPAAHGEAAFRSGVGFHGAPAAHSGAAVRAGPTAFHGGPAFRGEGPHGGERAGTHGGGPHGGTHAGESGGHHG
jgi:hypothetical protein